MARITARAPSAGLRAGSVARTIAKRRDKPYKTEQSRVLAKKKKLTTRTTYQHALPGFQFLAVGTPELAERCKEISRQKDLPIHIVNGHPVSKNARDPDKVSHHIARIGYHFRSEVVDQACQELHYQFVGGRFVSDADLRSEYERSRMAQTMAKHGMRLDQSSERETDDQVRAAIKELFPKIPEQDLKEILRHAWKKGSQRVGTNPLLELSRRVQLATIARIRHQYTDYDRLLRAFDWAYARKEVEPVCLAKLIEWRGENDQEDDDEFEEIVRETIVIDDDDEDGVSQDGDSDESMEISHRPAVDADLTAESHDENSGRLPNGHQPLARNTQQRDLDIRRKIGAVRQRLRNREFLRERPPLPTPPMTSRVIQINMPEDRDVVQIGGKIFRRATSATAVQPQAAPPTGLYAAPAPSRASHVHAQPVHVVDDLPLHERPVASIEPNDDLGRSVLPTQSSRPPQPRAGDGELSSGHHHSGHGAASGQPQYQSPFANASNGPGPLTGSGSIIDLTAESSPGQYPRDFQDPPLAYHGHQTMLPAPDGTRVRPGSAFVSARTLEYIPRVSSARNWAPHVHRAGPVDSQVAPIQYMPRPQPSYEGQYFPQPPYPPNYEVPGRPVASGVVPQPQVIFVPETYPRNTPQPVHGAPAAVQQIARPFVGHSPVVANQPADHFAIAPLPGQHFYYPR